MADELEMVWRHQFEAVIDSEGPSSPLAEAPPAEQKTFRHILYNQTSSLKELVGIKDFAKSHLVHEHSPLPREIANGLYYLAIAQAQNSFQVRITGLLEEKIHWGFEWCLRQPWLDVETKECIRTALTGLTS